ncbi:MAG TPA: LLM class flavin-dependent oxidoreductase [Candidatus Limnocylindrales bacterium]|nr:LLM class flavin-dependent oxidoreductase [Candidatus Limnocylindrales bacterium]
MRVRSEVTVDRLARPVGLGLAARGDVDDVIGWALQARQAGLDSVWIHDSYFERDAVSYASAICSHLGEPGSDDRFRVALGAVNPNTRHPVVLAMTGSALDEMAPGRVVMALGTGLPFRLKQMGIPYAPEPAIRGVSEALDALRTLWAGERLAPGSAGVPPVEPMFAPPHRIPLFIAAYRREFVTLASQKADGYLARPAESVPSLKGILARLRSAAAAAGRDPDVLETAGYLLTLVDATRREALNRAKREPFVIYMMSVLGDVSLRRAGFEPELRDRIAAAWREERFHDAGKLIPDELLDAFMLCGTREDVAAGAARFHEEAGLTLPLLQPVVQEAAQLDQVVAAARLYGGLADPLAAARSADPPTAVLPDGLVAAPIGLVAAPIGSSLADDRRLTRPQRLRRRLGAAWEIVRPFAYTASLVPVAAGGALAAVDGRFEPLPFVLALLGAVLLHSGTNVINEVYDVRQGIDTITSPRASHAILKGRISERDAVRLGLLCFGLATVAGLGLAALRGWPIVGLGLLGLAGGYFYTAPPFQYKFHALGVPLVFLLMGPLMTVGAYFAASGGWSATAVVLSLPVGLLVAAILHGNEWRDIGEDTRAGIVTLSARLGRDLAHQGYLVLILGAYVTLCLAVAVGLLPAATLLAILSLPFLAQVMRSAELGATGQARAIAFIDLQTAHLHLAFGALLVLGLVAAAALR